jgi:hypothetical protein
MTTGREAWVAALCTYEQGGISCVIDLTAKIRVFRQYVSPNLAILCEALQALNRPRISGRGSNSSIVRMTIAGKVHVLAASATPSEAFSRIAEVGRLGAHLIAAHESSSDRLDRERVIDCALVNNSLSLKCVKNLQLGPMPMEVYWGTPLGFLQLHLRVRPFSGVPSSEMMQGRHSLSKLPLHKVSNRHIRATQAGHN